MVEEGNDVEEEKMSEETALRGREEVWGLFVVALVEGKVGEFVVRGSVEGI